MTDDEWDERRDRAIRAAFETGRPVFADTGGVLRFTDGAREEVPAEVGVSGPLVARPTALAVRAQRASRFAFVVSLVAAAANGVAAIWNPWQWALVAVFGGCALVWRRVNRQQRRMSRVAGSS